MIRFAGHVYGGGKEPNKNLAMGGNLWLPSCNLYMNQINDQAWLNLVEENRNRSLRRANKSSNICLKKHLYYVFLSCKMLFPTHHWGLIAQTQVVVIHQSLSTLCNPYLPFKASCWSLYSIVVIHLLYSTPKTKFFVFRINIKLFCTLIFCQY